jgi:Glutathione S-transferase, N-terminal domain
MMVETPTLYVCHGDDGGPRVHPCRRVQEALRAAGIEYEKVIAAHGHPIPFLRKGSREDLRAATGDTKLPALKLPDGTVITHSRAIMAWIASQRCSAPAAVGDRQLTIRTKRVPCCVRGRTFWLSERVWVRRRWPVRRLSHVRPGESRSSSARGWR